MRGTTPPFSELMMTAATRRGTLGLAAPVVSVAVSAMLAVAVSFMLP